MIKTNESTPAIKNETRLTLRENESLDALLKRFKKVVNEMGVMDECRKREFYLKKSLKRKRKSKLAQIKARRK